MHRAPGFRGFTEIAWRPEPPWEAKMDPASGRPFYHNTQTGETTWTAPTSNQNVGVTMDGTGGDASKLQIPMPDKEKEPERYAAWENLMGHLKSGGNKGDGMCGDFQRGNCTRGANCKFSHGDIPTRGTQATDSKGVNMCNDFLKGDCFRGARCKFSHGDDPKNQTIGTGLNPQEAYGPRGGGGPGGGYGGGYQGGYGGGRGGYGGGYGGPGGPPRSGYGGGGYHQRDSRDDYRDRRDRGSDDRRRRSRSRSRGRRRDDRSRSRGRRRDDRDRARDRDRSGGQRS